MTAASASYTAQGNWDGGFYELTMELGDPADVVLQGALTALWRGAVIVGCHADRDREPADQDEVPCTVASLEEFGHLRGTVVVPGGHRVVCGVFATLLDDGGRWLTFYLPTGALIETDERIGGFPFGDHGGPESLRWRRDLDAWFALVGATVFDEVGFVLWLIGFEVDAGIDAASVAGQVPDQRWEGYLLPVDGVVRYTPANR